MKTKITTLIMIVVATGILVLSSCAKKDGKVIFWQSTTGTQYLVTTVTLNGATGSITVNKSSTPSCGDSGCANFTLQPGTYTYSATEASPGTATWSGSVTITEDGCLAFQLY